MVVDLRFAEQFAAEWARDWNSHDLERILRHFTDDVVFSSPMIAQILASDAEEVRGKDALREYWSRGLHLNPDLHFTVDDVKASVDTIVISYRNERNRASAEVLTFRAGRVCRGIAAHGQLPKEE